MPKVVVIIPAYNEGTSLPYVVKDIPREYVQEVIVVDNGSTDTTAAVARKVGCRVITEPRRGYGQACLTGITALPGDTDIVVFCDADYSDHPEQMPLLLTPILEGKADMVIGSRLQGNCESGAMLPQAYWGNKFACYLMQLFWGVRYTDLGPFRAIARPALEQLGMTDRDFGWTIEMQIKAAAADLRVMEVPVAYRRRIGQSKISGTWSGTLQAGRKILGTLFYYRFWPQPARGTSRQQREMDDEN